MFFKTKQNKQTNTIRLSRTSSSLMCGNLYVCTSCFQPWLTNKSIDKFPRRFCKVILWRRLQTTALETNKLQSVQWWRKFTQFVYLKTRKKLLVWRPSTSNTFKLKETIRSISWIDHFRALFDVKWLIISMECRQIASALQPQSCNQALTSVPELRQPPVLMRLESIHLTLVPLTSFIVTTCLDATWISPFNCSCNY